MTERSHTMAEDIKSTQSPEDFKAAGGNEGNFAGILEQIKPDIHKPRIGTEDHEDHIKAKSDQIDVARKQLEDVYTAQAEAAATTTDEPDKNHDHNLVIRKAESTQVSTDIPIETSAQAEVSATTSDDEKGQLVDTAPVTYISSEGQFTTTLKPTERTNQEGQSATGVPEEKSIPDTEAKPVEPSSPTLGTEDVPALDGQPEVEPKDTTTDDQAEAEVPKTIPTSVEPETDSGSDAETATPKDTEDESSKAESSEHQAYEDQYLELPDGTKVFNVGDRANRIHKWDLSNAEMQAKMKEDYIQSDRVHNREYRDPNLPVELGDSQKSTEDSSTEDEAESSKAPTQDDKPTGAETTTPSPIAPDSDIPEVGDEANPEDTFGADDDSKKPESPNPPPDSDTEAGDRGGASPETTPDTDAEDGDKGNPNTASEPNTETQDDPNTATPPDSDTTTPSEGQSEAQEAPWEAHARSVKEALADIDEMLGKAFREGMAAVEKFAGTAYEFSSEKIKDYYKDWRNNGRRRSESYRKRMGRAEGNTDSKWQKIRLGMIERSEQRRGAFWDKWLGTRIGQQEDERPGGQAERQRLVNAPEVGMDRAVRILANLRNDQERFRGIRLFSSREKVRQIEEEFRELASQEVADKVEVKVVEGKSLEKAGKIIKDTLAPDPHDMDNDDLLKYVEQLNTEIASKGEFNPMLAKAEAYLQSGNNGNQEDRLAGIAMLDTIKALNDAHVREEINDATLHKANTLVYEGKTSDEVIAELERGIDPAEIQATAVSSILEIMQKVDQAKAETKSTRRKNDGKIHSFLSSPGWKKTTGTVIAGSGAIGMIFTGPVGAVVAGAGIFMARQGGMRERVENKTNKQASKQAELIDQMTEDPVMRELYRRLDVAPQSRGGEVEDLPVREHIDRDELENLNARELAEALGDDEILTDVEMNERRKAVTDQIIDSLLSASHERARTKLVRRAKSTAYSAGASALPVGATIAATGGLFAGTLMGLASVGVPLFGAWRRRKAYAPPATAS